jgi:hypothetical protein
LKATLSRLCDAIALIFFSFKANVLGIFENITKTSKTT